MNLLWGARRARRGQGEDGVYVVLFAISVLTVMAMAALAVDLSSLRADRRTERLTADLAATAGAIELSPQLGRGPVVACQTAWQVFLQNAPGSGSSVSAPPCSTAFTGTCGATARSAVGTAGPYTVTITNPVPDTDPLMTATGSPGGTPQGTNSTIDGTACSRLGINVVRARSAAFGAVVGQPTSSTSVHSVARATSGSRQVIAALVVLDPTKCGALVAAGQAGVTVNPSGTYPGTVLLDSDGSDSQSCGNNQYTVMTQGNLNSSVHAVGPGGGPGVLRLFAMPLSQTNCTGPVIDACDPASVASSRLSPQPTPSDSRLTRAPVDWFWNCKSDYGSLNIVPCPSPTATSAYIDALVTAMGDGSAAPAGYQTYTTYVTTTYGITSPCALPASAPAITLPIGNWWVNCPSFSEASSVTFSGGNVLFQGSVAVKSSGVLNVNTANTSGTLPSTCYTQLCPTQFGSDAAFVYFASGGLTKDAQSSIDFLNTAVYFRNGVINLTGGSGSLIWGRAAGGPVPQPLPVVGVVERREHGRTIGSRCRGGLLHAQRAALQLHGTGLPGANQSPVHHLRHVRPGTGQSRDAARSQPDRPRTTTGLTSHPLNLEPAGRRQATGGVTLAYGVVGASSRRRSTVGRSRSRSSLRR